MQGQPVTPASFSSLIPILWNSSLLFALFQPSMNRKKREGALTNPIKAQTR